MWDTILTAIENFAGSLYDFLVEPEYEELGFEKSGGRWLMGSYIYG